MKQQLRLLITQMLENGAATKRFIYKCGESTRSSAAYICASVPDREAFSFYQKCLALADRDYVTFFIRSLPTDQASLESWRQNGPLDVRADIFLILDAALELQFDIVAKFGTDKSMLQRLDRCFSAKVLERFDSNGTKLIEELVVDQKHVLESVAKVSRFVVTKIMAGAIVVSLTRKLASPEIDMFFDDFIAFKRKYDRMEMSEKTLRRMILNHQTVGL